MRTIRHLVETLSSRCLPAVGPLPTPDHVVVVVEENHGYGQIVGAAAAPYLNGLAAAGALFTDYRAVAHPSQPNYLALFSGSTQGVADDSTPHAFDAPNLGGELIAAGRSFAGYSESLPAAGFTGSTAGPYARKHNPWVNFSDVPAAANQPLGAFPADFSQLPTVSFVVPNLNNDMHDGSVARGDAWLRDHLGAYARWAAGHNSLLVVTWDEDDSSGGGNRVPTIVVGAGVRAGRYPEPATHYTLLRTLSDLYGLPAPGAAASAAPITDIWADGTPTPTPTPVPTPASTGVVKGRVFDDRDGDGRRDPGDGPVVGVGVLLDVDGNGSAGPGEPATTTAADGSYAFPGVGFGTYPVVVAAPDGWRATTPAAAVAVRHQGVAKARPAGLTRSAAVAGTVFRDDDGDGVRQAAEPGLSRWTVYLDVNGDGRRQAGEPAAKTDKAGHWAILGVAAGTYPLGVAVRHGYVVTVPAGGPPAVDLAAGQLDADRLFGVRRQA